MATYPLRIPKQAWDGLAALAKLSPENVAKLTSIIDSEPVQATFQPLARRFATEVGITEEEGLDLLRWVLIPLADLAGRPDVTPTEIADALVEAATTQSPEERKPEMVALRDLLPSLPPLFADLKTRQWYKAQQLQYDRPALLQDVKILTEMRPLIDHEVTRTEAFVISTSLVVEYTNSRGTEKLFLTMDTDDLDAMAREIDRAKRKIALMVQQAAGWQVPLLGAES